MVTVQRPGEGVGSRVTQWLTPIVAVGLAAGMRYLLEPLVGLNIPYALFFLATAITALRAGFRPALLASVLSVIVADYLFIEPLFSISIPSSQDVWTLALFFVTQLAISLLGFETQRSHKKLEETIETLHESERTLQATFQNAASGIVRTDSEDRFVAVNDRLCKMLGFSREELLGMSVRELTWFEDRPKSDDLNKRLHEGQLSFLSYDKRYRKKDGSPLWVHVAVSAARDESGRYLYSVGTVLDITAAKKAEEALRQSELFYRQTLESIPGMVFTTRPDGYCDYQSRQWVYYTGVPMEEHLGDGWNKLLHPEDRPGAFAAWQAAVEDKAPYDLEYRVRRHDGTYEWFKVRGEPIRDENGKIVRWFGIATNIEAIKRAEGALRESEERVHRKLESVMSPEGDIDVLELKDLIDAPAVQKLMEHFYKVSGIPIGIVDSRGTVLIGVGWQDICAGYHRVHPKTAGLCIESDTELTTGLSKGESRLYKCKNNLWDMATPVIVGGRHIGNIFTGQFFFEDEVIDREFFRARAKELGFDEKEYLEALDRVPRFNRKTIEDGMAFFAQLAEMLSQLGYGNVKLARVLQERERLIGALTESEERYRRFVKVSSDVEWRTNAEGEICGGDESWCDFTGQTPAEASGYGWLNAVAEKDREKTLAVWKKALEIKEFYEVEYALHRRDGSWRDVIARGVPITRGDGSIKEWQGACFDITERKRAEEALRLSNAELAVERARWRGIVEGMAEEVWACDAAGRMSLLNLGTVTPMGLPEFRDKTVDEVLEEVEILNADDRPRPPEDAPLLRALQGEVVRGEELMRHRKTGIERWRAFSAAPMRSASGAINGAVAVVRDITDRKQLEEEYKAAIISAERAKAAADQANTAKDQFLAMLSHELRTPLTPVLAATALIKRRTDVPAQVLEHVDLIKRNVSVEARLIDDLLDLTRIARGKIALEKVRINVCQVLSQVSEVCRSDIETKRLHFGVKIDGAPLPIFADSSRIQQVFWNLVKNSIKFTQEGGCVGIWAYPEGSSVVIEVNDSGIGIEPEVLPKVFNAFEQGDQRITRQFGGLGLGLAITKRLVDMHGGTITAESEGKGKGATFRVVLPLIAKEVEADKNRDKEKGLFPNTMGMQILLVEDHGDTALMIKALLESSGHKVCTAGDAVEALEAVSENKFDLLISDLGLPDKSGFELMQELRSSGCRTKAIALSGFGREEDVKRSKEAGFNDHMTKPVDFDALLATVERVVEARVA